MTTQTQNTFQEAAKLTQNLSKWQDSSKKVISDVLKRLEKLQFDDLLSPTSTQEQTKGKASEYKFICLVSQSYSQFQSQLAKPILNFHKYVTQDFYLHRQIQNLDEDQVDNDWFGLLIKLKKKIKKTSELIEARKKKAQKDKLHAPQLKNKQSTVIEYPAQLQEGCRQSQRKILQILYKNFVHNFPEAINNPVAIKFIKQVNVLIRKQFELQLDTKRDKRIDSICVHLAKQTATKAKQQMLDGKKTAKQVANDQQMAYRDEQSLARIQSHIKEQLKVSETGYYDEMKKNINKGASEQCKFCRKLSAYCDDMKQIRASDEPMTRFMKCNNCGKNWRD